MLCPIIGENSQKQLKHLDCEALAFELDLATNHSKKHCLVLFRISIKCCVLYAFFCGGGGGA